MQFFLNWYYLIRYHAIQAAAKQITAAASCKSRYIHVIPMSSLARAFGQKYHLVVLASPSASSPTFFASIPLLRT